MIIWWLLGSNYLMITWWLFDLRSNSRLVAWLYFYKPLHSLGKSAQRFALLRQQHLSAQGSWPSHHAKSDAILHTGHKSLSQWVSVFRPIRAQGCHNWILPTIMKIIIKIAIVTILYDLALHLLSIICTFEAQVPGNANNKMQHLLVEKKIRESSLIRVHTPGKIASLLAGHDQHEEWHYFVSSHFCLDELIHHLISEHSVGLFKAWMKSSRSFTMRAFHIII